jgi:hypothetical protein
MYESDTSTVTTALQSSSTAVFTDDTISKILALTTVDNATVRFDTVTPDASGVVTVASGAEVVLISSSDTTQTTLTPPSNAPVVIFQGKGGVITTLNDGPSTVPAHAAGITDRVVVGSSGNDSIVISDNKNTLLTLGTGNSTVIAGAGSDTVVAGLGNSTIAGGTGHAIVDMAGNASDYTVSVSGGHAVVTQNDSGLVTDISKIQFVQLDDGESLVFAKDSTQAAVSTLYSAAFGRDADGGGIKFYFDAANQGVSLKQIAEFFLSSPEYQAMAAQTDAQFISNLYQNTFARAGDADGVAFWTNALANGLSRADLLMNFVSVAAHNLDGVLHTEATVVGTVTIVHNIV